MAFGLIYLALRLPFFAQAKASYGLAAAPLLSLFFAVGLGRLDDALELGHDAWPRPERLDPVRRRGSD